VNNNNLNHYLNCKFRLWIVVTVLFTLFADFRLLVIRFCWRTRYVFVIFLCFFRSRFAVWFSFSKMIEVTMLRKWFSRISCQICCFVFISWNFVKWRVTIKCFSSLLRVWTVWLQYISDRNAQGVHKKKSTATSVVVDDQFYRTFSSKHGNRYIPGCLSVRLSVCPSVCLFVAVWYNLYWEKDPRLCVFTTELEVSTIFYFENNRTDGQTDREQHLMRSPREGRILTIDIQPFFGPATSEMIKL